MSSQIIGGSNGNPDPSSPAGVLNDVWDETNHLLRTGPGSLGSSTSGTSKSTAGPPAAGQTAKTYNGKQALSVGGTTTITLETVTTGKTFYITDIFISTDVASGTQILDTRLQSAGLDIFRAGIHNLSPVEMPGIDTQPSAASTQVVTMLLPTLASGSGSVYYFIAGYEQ